MDPIVVPDKAIKYILFQRPAHQRFLHTSAYALLNKILPFRIYNQITALEAKINPSKIKLSYENDMNREYLSIKEFLPKECSSILDIGCGVGGIDVLLSKHYQDNKQLAFYLLDKTKIEKDVFYEFKPKGAFYNSLDVAKTMLSGNGIPEKNIHLLEVGDANRIDIDCNIDLIISFASWGFHYPIETYLAKVYDVLGKDGYLIVDIRKGTNGVDVLKSIFGKLNIILDRKKFQRVLVSKQ